MASFRFEANNKPSRSGKYSVFLCISTQGIRKRIKTTVELKDRENLNSTSGKDKWITSDEANYKKLNSILADDLQRAKDAYSDLNKQGKASAQKIIEVLNRTEKPFSYFEFAYQYANKTLEAGDYNTYKKYITALIKLKFFVNGRKPDEIIRYKRKKLQEELGKMKKDLLFEDITLGFLSKFHSYLQKQPNLRNPNLTLHPNTISKVFDQLASLFKKGIIAGKEQGLNISYNPFEDLQSKPIPNSKEKLTMDEIMAIKGLKLDQGAMLWHCRNYFLFSFYCAGMRAGDLIQLRQSNIHNGRLQYAMGKTDRIRDIKLLPEAIEILNHYMNLDQPTTDYIFPLLDNRARYAVAVTSEDRMKLQPEVKKRLLQQVNSKNSLINKYLGKIAEMAGINKKLTFHIARHSFANIARQKKANVFDISKTLGHSSIKITEAYLSNFDTISQDETMEKVFQPDSIGG